MQTHIHMHTDTDTHSEHNKITIMAMRNQTTTESQVGCLLSTTQRWPQSWPVWLWKNREPYLTNIKELDSKPWSGRLSLWHPVIKQIWKTSHKSEVTEKEGVLAPSCGWWVPFLWGALDKILWIKYRKHTLLQTDAQPCWAASKTWRLETKLKLSKDAEDCFLG